MNKRFQEILQLAQTGQINEALKRCDKAIKKKPNEVDFLLLGASLYAQQGNYAKIVDYCLRAHQLSPKNQNALYNLVVAFLFLEDYENAIKYSLPLIKLDNRNAKAYSNLGLAYWHTGDLDKAKENTLTSLKLDASTATTHNNLGLIYKSYKDYDNAITSFNKAISLDMQLAEAHFNCGVALIETGDDQGNSYLDKALLIKPDYPEANNYKGLQLLEAGQTVGAIDHFKKAITHKTNYDEAYCNLGNAFTTQKEFASAEAMYRKAIEHNPQYANAYNNLGNTLMNQESYKQHLKEAEECYVKSIELAPELYDAYKNLAVYYQGEGIQDKAIEYFKQYREKVPEDDSAAASMAEIHERDGKFDEAMTVLKPAIDSGNPSAKVILAYATLAKHFKFIDEAIEMLLSIDDENTLKADVVEKYYILGKLSESKKQPDTTFSYYKSANDLDEESYDLEKDKKLFDATKIYFTKEKIQSLPRSEVDSTLPIFIVGMPRSGTSLAEQVLSSHPDVYGAGELDKIETLISKLRMEIDPLNNQHKNFDKMTQEQVNAASQSHIGTLQAMSPESKYIVDKMPHNFLGLAEINLMFPKATVIHCKRSPVDTCLSIYFQHFNKNHAYSNSLKYLGQYYNLYADLMEHWKQVLDINLVELEYEKVIANPEEEMRNLLKNCGISWNPACLKFHENKRTVMTPSYDQVRQPIYTSSVAKWKKFEPHIGDLLENLGKHAY